MHLLLRGRGCGLAADEDMAVISDHNARKGFADLGLATLIGVASPRSANPFRALWSLMTAMCVSGANRFPCGCAAKDRIYAID